MRSVLNSVNMEGVVVIGEGEKDEVCSKPRFARIPKLKNASQPVKCSSSLSSSLALPCRLQCCTVVKSWELEWSLLWTLLLILLMAPLSSPRSAKAGQKLIHHSRWRPILLNAMVCNEGSHGSLTLPYICLVCLGRQHLSTKVEWHVQGRSGAVSVIALAERGALFDPGPCMYMEKLAVGPQVNPHMVSLLYPIDRNLRVRDVQLHIRHAGSCALTPPKCCAHA